MTIDRLKEELQKIERSLSVEFNGVKGQYVVFGIDGKHRKYVLYSVPLGKLAEYSNQILEEVRKAKFFSAKEKNQRIDEMEEREERHAEKTLEEDMAYAVSESYDVFKRMEGSRITLPDTGFEVRDFRRATL